MVVIVMGVTGAGKTTVGRLLAGTMGWAFYDADEFHPEANVRKMSQGIPLGDEDRIPWLERLGEHIRGCLDREEDAVVACSALRKAYREYLMVDDPRVRLVYLQGRAALIRERLLSRRGHFMNPMLLTSQFETLEEPANALTVDVSGTPEEIVSTIRTEIGV